MTNATSTPTRLLATAMFLLFTAGCYTVQPADPTAQQRADQLARSVAMASGGATWPRVQTVAFNFVVREGDQIKVNRAHLWNVRANTDTITDQGKPAVTVSTVTPNPADGAEADAYKAWAHDTYWLLAPLKSFDPGATRQHLGERDVAGKTYQVLGVSFLDNGATTPGGRYNFYVDPLTSLIAFSDDMPNPETSTRASWERYQHPAGLKLATYHQMGPRTISIENLSVTTD